MLELSLLENMREIPEKTRQKPDHHATLETGKLSCVEPNALRFDFDMVMKDSFNPTI